MNSHIKFSSFAKIFLRLVFFLLFHFSSFIIIIIIFGKIPSYIIIIMIYFYFFLTFQIPLSLSLSLLQKLSLERWNPKSTAPPPLPSCYSFFSRATLYDVRSPKSSSIITILFGKNYNFFSVWF